MIEVSARADAEAFLGRLLRLDPTALVRLRPASLDRGGGDREGADRGGAEMWAMLPFRVLVRLPLSGVIDGDFTVSAADLLASVADPSLPDPPRRDAAWRWPLPSSTGRLVETVPAAEVARVAVAASRTLRAAMTHGVAGRAVGERAVRDALLDHVPIVVTGAHKRIEVPQRLVQAVVQMGFLGPRSPHGTSDGATFGDAFVAVRFASAWIGLITMYGCAWYRESSPLHLS